MTNFVGRALIDTLVSYSADEGLKWVLPGDSGLTVDGQAMSLSAASRQGQTTIGQVLIEQNALRLAEVFGEESAQAKEAFECLGTYQARRMPWGLIDASAVVHAVTEYEKHVSGGELWEMSLAAWINARIMSRAARALVRRPEQIEATAG